MANSLRAKLSKLRRDRYISEKEYQAFIKKLDGHDKQLRADAIDECKAVILERCAEPCHRNYDCLKCLADKCEMLKEKKYDTI